MKKKMRISRSAALLTLFAVVGSPLVSVNLTGVARAAADSAASSTSFNAKLAGLSLGMSAQQADDIIKTRDLVNEPTPFYEQLPDGSHGPLKALSYIEKVGNLQFEVSVGFSRVTGKVMLVSYEVWGEQTADLLAAAKAKYGPPHDVVVMDNRRVDPRVDHPYVWGNLHGRHLELTNTNGPWVLSLEDAVAEKRDAAYVAPGSAPSVPKL